MVSMRFSITYDIKGIPELPLDYRGGFVTLIRSALDKDNCGQSCKDILVNYPLCFAIRFDKKPEIKEGKFLIGRNIHLYISTPSFILGTAIYNGLLSIKNFSLYNTEIEKRSILYINERNIQNNIVTFATLSPIIIRNQQRRNRYVLPGEEGFEESLSNTFCEQWKLYNKIHMATLGAVRSIDRSKQFSLLSRSLELLLHVSHLYENGIVN